MEASRSNLVELLELQRIDSTIDRLEARKSHLPEQAELDASEEKLAMLENDLAEQQATTDEILARQAKLDGEIELLGEKLRSEEQKLYSGNVSTPKELSALQAETESLKRRISSLEDSDLEVMEERESAEGELKRLSDELIELRRSIEELIVRRDHASGEIDEQLEAARAERQNWLPRFGSELLSLYDDLRSSKGGVAIAALIDGTCQGCHMKLPVQEAARVKNSESMSYCDECRRILVPL